MPSRWLRTLVVAVLLSGGLLVPAAPTATADTACGRWSWSDVDADGIPRPMAYDGWGDCPSARGALWWARWSYPDYPLLCVPSSSTQPAWELIWVTDADRPRTPLLETSRGLVRNAVRRAVSVFAASRNAAIRSRADLATAATPRIVTVRDRSGRCQPRFARATVPREVLRREPYQNWTNPATGVLEQGLWPYLEDHGFPARADRRYITVTDDRGVWNFLGGATIIPCSGSGYGPADLQPGSGNCNQAGGTWMTVSTNNLASDFRPDSTGTFGERLAHELVHGMGAVLEGSPHFNTGNWLHPSDCADLLCYNYVDADGQHYDRCGGSPADTWAAFTGGASTSRAAYRLDCGRDDYFAYRLVHGVVEEQVWAASRWAGENNRFYWGGDSGYAGPVFTNRDYRIPPECTYDPAGWCPPGVAGTARSRGDRWARPWAVS